MDLSNKIMIGYCIMAVGGLFFIITLLMTIFLPMTASLNVSELANAPSNISTFKYYKKNYFSYNICYYHNVWLLLQNKESRIIKC